MGNSHQHIDWLVKANVTLKTKNGRKVKVWDFLHQKDEHILKHWAVHFRNHYCSDKQIDLLCKGTGLSRSDYLNKIKFPDSTIPPGLSIRAGDFAEILVADYLEYKLNYWVPRFHYIDKAIRNESEKGSDTIGFFFIKDGKSSPKDKLVIYESKAQYSGRTTKSILQEAINDSSKDLTRKAESLNAIKQKIIDQGDLEFANKVERFQNEVDNPYIQVYGAVAHWEKRLFDISVVNSTTTLS